MIVDNKERRIILKFSGSMVASKREERDWDISRLFYEVVKIAPSGLRPSTAYLKKLEAGDVPNPGAAYLSILSQIFGCSIDEFFEKEEVNDSIN